jgi:hypothetical protein
MTSKSGAPTPDGGNYSGTRTDNSSIGPTRKYLTSQDLEMKKWLRSKFGATTDPMPRDGELSM